MDYLFYAGLVYGKDTFDSGHAPVWRFVAKHAHFLPKVTNVATRYLERAFGIDKGAGLPKVRFAFHSLHLIFIGYFGLLLS